MLWDLKTLTNNFHYVMFWGMLNLKKEKDVLRRLGQKKTDLVAEQVKKVLAGTDQKLILMVRG